MPGPSDGPLVTACAATGSPASSRAVDWCARLAASERAVLWVIHIAGTGAGDPETAVARLKAWVRRLRADGLTASLHVVRGYDGPVSAAIAVTAEAVGADLLVVGASSRLWGDGGMGADLLGLAPCPLLTVPAAAQEPTVAPVAARYGAR